MVEEEVVQYNYVSILDCAGAQDLQRGSETRKDHKVSVSKHYSSTGAYAILH